MTMTYLCVYVYNIFLDLAVLAERSHFRSRFCNCFAFSNVSSLKVLTVGEITLEGDCFFNMSGEMFTAWTSLSGWFLTSDFLLPAKRLPVTILLRSLGKAAWTSMHVNLMGIPFHHEKPDWVRASVANHFITSHGLGEFYLWPIHQLPKLSSGPKSPDGSVF